MHLGDRVAERWLVASLVELLYPELPSQVAQLNKVSFELSENTMLKCSPMPGGAPGNAP